MRTQGGGDSGVRRGCPCSWSSAGSGPLRGCGTARAHPVGVARRGAHAELRIGGGEGERARFVWYFCGCGGLGESNSGTRGTDLLGEDFCEKYLEMGSTSLQVRVRPTPCNDQRVGNNIGLVDMANFACASGSGCCAASAAAL